MIMDKEKLEKIAEERFKMPEPLTPNMAIEASMVHVQRKAFISGYNYAKQESEGLREEWISVEDRLPEAVDKKMRPVLVLIGKRQAIAFYFPDKFKTVEWEDWDDYKPEYFPWTTEDKEQGIVWLNAGFYTTESCETCDREVWSRPLKVSHWAPLPSPPHLNKANDERDKGIKS